jgi:hypothetical protein
MFCFGSWVKTTENHHGNRMHGMYFGSKRPLHRLLAVFSISRTRPCFGVPRQSIVCLRVPQCIMLIEMDRAGRKNGENEIEPTSPPILISSSVCQ